MRRNLAASFRGVDGPSRPAPFAPAKGDDPAQLTIILDKPGVI
ncbi:hypothetical protein [Paludibaculum fermentans]